MDSGEPVVGGWFKVDLPDGNSEIARITTWPVFRQVICVRTDEMNEGMLVIDNRRARPAHITKRDLPVD